MHAVKEIDTREYVTVLRELTEEGKEVSLLISGSSMSPFLIHHRDTIYFRKPDRKLRRGDMVFYERPGGQFVMHRICRVGKEGLYLIGDAQTEVEGPLDPSCVFARIIRVRRKGRLLAPGDFWWEFFEHVWLGLIPFRRGLMRIYAGIYRRKSKKSRLAR